MAVIVALLGGDGEWTVGYGDRGVAVNLVSLSPVLSGNVLPICANRGPSALSEPSIIHRLSHGYKNRKRKKNERKGDEACKVSHRNRIFGSNDSSSGVTEALLA